MLILWLMFDPLLPLEFYYVFAFCYIGYDCRIRNTTTFESNDVIYGTNLYVPYFKCF